MWSTNTIAILVIIVGVTATLACYEFTSILPNPCAGEKCPFGAECVPSFDGRSYECSCPKCASYGDSQDSKPICGSDGRDYSSLCELSRHACSLSRTVSVRYNGSCDPCFGVKCPDSQICTIDDNRYPICKCNAACGTDYAPVCGNDGRDYVNECVLRVEACKFRKSLRILHQGICADANACKTIKCSKAYQECETNRFGIAVCQCPPPCSKVLKPVCGTDSNTYDSICELRRQSCLNNLNVTVRYFGPCDSDNFCHQNHGVCKFGSTCLSVSGTDYTCVCDECPDDYAPVCGSNLISYGNFCKFRQHMCETQTTNVTVRQGACEGCENMNCLFYSHCSTEDRYGTPKCVCPSNCPKVQEPVCGSDLVTYPNECELKRNSCKNRKYIVVIKRGLCSSCAGVHCDFGAKCENGICVCPTKCPNELIEPVCGSNHISYDNVCQLMAASCESTTQISVKSKGWCDEDNIRSGGSGQSSIAIKQNIMQLCPMNICKYGGVCVQYNSENSHCFCNFNCSIAASGINSRMEQHNICGNDGRLYTNECAIREEMCSRQQEVTVMDKQFCENFRDIPCEGEPPLRDEQSNREYNCSEKRCPENSYCHRRLNFAKCCRENDPDEDCVDSVFGCCSDGHTHSLGPKQAGCPNTCQCNRLGSYSLKCDAVTRQCYCKPGVGGLRCDRCEPGYWGLHKISNGNAGCIPCNCNKIGSLRDDCEQMSGRCVCKSEFRGMKCDICSDGSLVEFGGCARVQNISCLDNSQCQFGALCSDFFCRCRHDCSDAIKSPVCSNEGVIFESECHLKLWSCKAQKSIRTAHPEKCRSSAKNSATTSPVRRSTEYQSYDKYTTLSRSPADELDSSTLSLTSPTAPTVNEWQPDLEQFPFFDGNAYIEKATMQAYSKVSIQIEFIAYDADGTILFNCQNSNGEGDFITILLKNLYIEFRFNLGSGSVTLRSSKPITLGRRVTVDARRNLSEGFLSIDGVENVTAKSEGPHKLLDLGQNLFIGGTPYGDAKRVIDNLGTKKNFTGCIRSLQINDEVHDLNAVILEKAINSWQIERCSQQQCSKWLCHNRGICVQNEQTHSCLCDPKSSGQRCQRPINQQIDSIERSFVALDFWNESYIELPTLQGVNQMFALEVWFMTRSPNGLILYNGQSKGDFVELAIVDSYVHYSFNLGGQSSKSGIVLIRSTTKLALGEWHRVVIARKSKEGSLQINNEPAIKDIAKGNLNELNLDEPLYLGGTSKSLKRKSTSATASVNNLNGVIQRIALNGQLWQDMLSRPIKLQSVHNYLGPPCGDGNVCYNEGNCIPWLNSIMCQCISGFHGIKCEQTKDSSVKPTIVDRSVYVEYTSNNFPHFTSQENVFEMTLRTKSENGLLLWISKGTTTMADYLTMVLHDGYFVLSFDLGKQTKHLAVRSAVRIDDGENHHIVVMRNKQVGTVQVDNHWMSSVVSEKGATDLNTDGKLWIGGVGQSAADKSGNCDHEQASECGETNLPPGLPDPYYSTLIACLSTLRVQGIAVDLSNLGGGGEALKQC